MLFHRARRCEIHDRPSPAKIARLEVETGVNPDALRDLDTGDFVTDHANSDLIDCRHRWCTHGK